MHDLETVRPIFVSGLEWLMEERNMDAAEDFMSKLDAYVTKCIREHKPGTHHVDLNIKDNPTRADVVHSLQRLIRETALKAVESTHLLSQQNGE
ncbi:MAG TPA: hypothetical protein VK724_12610 [Bryobacteraceae bacterium]|nr:hypothetical protein [Bryobacteraceae bacterium]